MCPARKRSRYLGHKAGPAGGGPLSNDTVAAKRLHGDGGRLRDLRDDQPVLTGVDEDLVAL
jgi:hypothetical protein